MASSCKTSRIAEAAIKLMINEFTGRIPESQPVTMKSLIFINLPGINRNLKNGIFQARQMYQLLNRNLPEQQSAGSM